MGKKRKPGKKQKIQKSPQHTRAKKERTRRPARVEDPRVAHHVLEWAASLADDAGEVSEKQLRRALHRLLRDAPTAQSVAESDRRWVIQVPGREAGDHPVPAEDEGRPQDPVDPPDAHLLPAPTRAVDALPAIPDPVSDRDLEELDLMTADAAALARPCVMRGAGGVVAGFELDGRPIEAAWPDRRVGIITDGAPAPDGWQVVTCPGGTPGDLATLLGIELELESVAPSQGAEEQHFEQPAATAGGAATSGDSTASQTSAPTRLGPTDAVTPSGSPTAQTPVSRRRQRTTTPRVRSASHMSSIASTRRTSNGSAAERTPSKGDRQTSTKSGDRARGLPHSATEPEGSPPSIGADIELYRWQAEALRKWRRAGHHGVIEAVTGSGKTRLAIAAIRRALTDGGQVLIVVPTKELLDQWAGTGPNATGPVGALNEVLGLRRDRDIGVLGDGHTTATFADYDVIVGIVNTVRAKQPAPRRPSSIIVIDECHRVGSESNRAALIDGFDRRLGLSATVERSDGSHTAVLAYFGGNLIPGCDYRRGIAEGVISRYKLALVGARFSPEEMTRYTAFTRDMALARDRLVREHDAPTDDFAAFMTFVNNLKTFGTMREGIAAGRYLTPMSGRRRLLAESDAKLTSLVSLVPSITAAERAIIFTDTKGAARRARTTLAGLGVDGQVIDSEVSTRRRRQLLQDFRDGETRVIIAPRVLDEGVDVPAADLAVVMAASSSRRQMIQRMGRVLRRGDGRGYARFAVSFIEGTAEDPSNGSHEEFLSLVEEHATQSRRFTSNTSQDVITRFLTASRAQTAQPSPDTVVDRVSAAAARSVATRLRDAETVRRSAPPTPRRMPDEQPGPRKPRSRRAHRPERIVPAAGCEVVTPTSVSVVTRAQAQGFRVTRIEVVKDKTGQVLREGKRNGIVVVDLPPVDCLDADRVRQYVQRHFAERQGKPVQAQSAHAGRGFIFTQAVTRITWLGRNR